MRRYLSFFLALLAASALAKTPEYDLFLHTNFNGAIITNLYDAVNRLTARIYPNGTSNTFTYTATGQRATMHDASGNYSYTYDAFDRVTTNITPQGTLYYGYDVSGNVTNIHSSTANGTSVTYQYDLLGRLTNVVDARISGSTRYGFDSVGNLQSMAYPNGVTNLYQYDPQNRLTNLVWKLNNSSLASFGYTLGATGNRITSAETVNGTSRTYAWSYDYLYRLTSEAIQNIGTVNYSFDAVGNRTNRTSSISGIANQSPTYTANDWLTSDSYDANGNTTNSVGKSYQYDYENRLTNFNNGQVILVYDADGNRVKKITSTATTLYLVDTHNPSGYAQVLEELTVSGGTTNLAKAYTYGLDLISQRQPNVSTNFYGYDGHGSTRFLTGLNGAVTDTYVYDAYGTLIVSTGSTLNNYLYCGEQWDSDLGFYYNRARYLNPNTGRFWTSDSDEGDNEDPLSLHKYLYCHDNSVNGMDPSGHDLMGVMSSMYIQVNIAAASFLTTYGAMAETAALVGAVSMMNSAQLLTTGVDPETGQAVTAAGVIFAIGDFLPGGQLITKPLNLAAKKIYWKGARATAKALGADLEEADVHHRIPLEWAHIFSNLNPNRISNLQVIKRDIHNGKDGITSAWRQFKASLNGKIPTQQQILDMANQIDSEYKDFIQNLW